MIDYRAWLEDRVPVEDADDDEVLILCPFHDDTNPSMSVNTKKGVFHCFSCKESGGFSKLIAKLDGVDERGVRQMLEAGDTQETVGRHMLNAMEDYAEELEDDELKFFSKKAFHRFFPSVLGTPGEKYLEHRAISRKTAEWFDLRWGTEGVMKNRVVFPVYSAKGKLITYGGRAITPGVMPKTRKAASGLRGLYGMYEALRQKDDFGNPKLPDRPLIIVEGEFDAMYLQQFGLCAVSTMGTQKLTGDQMRLIMAHASLVCWSYDGDDAGRKAQARGVLATKSYLPTIEVKLGDGLDPNELSPREVRRIYGGMS